MWHTYINATTIEDVLQTIHAKGEHSRIIAGGTDLILELERGVRKGIETIIDVTRIPGLDKITMDEDGVIHLGPLVTHNHCVESKLIRERAYPLARAAWEVGAPQIRNRGTIAGNLITASPANDTITPLMALGASVTLRSVNGTRTIALKNFYTGVRKTVMQADEMLVDISFLAMKTTQRGTFIKLALRRAQAISLVDAAILLDLDSDSVSSASITLGAVAPTIIHAPEAEKYLAGKKLTDDVIAEAARLTMDASKPIDDIRGSASYRREMVRVCTMRGLKSIRDGQEQAGMPSDAVLLWGKQSTERGLSVRPEPHAEIETTINGKKYSLKTGHEKTLLRFLREDIGLTGTKEGCAEGECGACTIFLNGKAVMACLVPAPRAHEAEITTIEGLALSGGLSERSETKTAVEALHPVQEAFIKHGAVQCGYCTPGFVMSAAMLMEEKENPTKNEIEQAITGNLCRCTGYYKIVQAIEDAKSMTEVKHG
ncbi:MAG: FAD binding domain-containing protein [Anaerolineae bacterium]|nr:FAD binding domain-containing protein [Anaerolineae bacterium]MBL8104031.1 FAD binding domain-containing protein [Anaerolineales bacterium]MCC7190796.1 FAD binding domain-containing protein [Anaerolineales bacterium]